MKTKNIFRVFLTAVFVLGAMALNAQTKIYVHKTDGTSDEFNIANLDSISFNPKAVVVVPPDGNLLVNPGFEDASPTTGGTLASLTPSGCWVAMTAADLTADNEASSGTTIANRLPPYVNGSTDAIWKLSVAAGVVDGGFIGVHGGDAAARCIANNNSGVYQLVNVTPGKTYSFSAWVLHYITNAAGQSTHTEYVRIKSADGSEELTSAEIGTENNVWMQASGTVKIPSDYAGTQVRFQVSHYNWGAATDLGQAPATLIDDCEFREVE